MRKFSNIDFFLKILPLKDDELVMSEMQKKWGGTDFVLERICLEEHLNLSKLGFVNEDGYSGYKSQNIAIRALKGNIFCQILFKWTYKGEFSQLVRFLKAQVHIYRAQSLFLALGALVQPAVNF